MLTLMSWVSRRRRRGAVEALRRLWVREGGIRGPVGGSSASSSRSCSCWAGRYTLVGRGFLPSPSSYARGRLGQVCGERGVPVPGYDAISERVRQLGPRGRGLSRRGTGRAPLALLELAAHRLVCGEVEEERRGGFVCFFDSEFRGN